MAGNDELFRAMGMFKEGVRELQLGRTLSAANEEVQKIRAAEMDEETRAAQLRQTAERLTFNMAQLGAPASQIDSVTQNLVPKPQLLQTAEQAVLMGNKAQREAGQQLIDQEFKNKQSLQKEKLDYEREISGQKNYVKERQAFKKELDTFRDKVAKNELKGLDELEMVGEEISKGNLGYVSSIRGLIKRNDPRISDEDFRSHIPNTDLASKAARVYEALINNRPLPKDAEAVKAMVNTLKARTKERVKTKAQGFSRNRAKFYRDTDPSDFYNQLVTESLPGSVEEQVSQTPPQPGSDLQQFQQQTAATPAPQQGGGANKFFKKR